jgi:hypothetical protein
MVVPGNFARVRLGPDAPHVRDRAAAGMNTGPWRASQVSARPIR